MTHDHEDLLRRLTVGDEGATASTVCLSESTAAPGLGPKHTALVRLAGLMAMSAPTAAYQWCVDLALAAGATDDEVVGVLIGVAPVVGTARVVAAAPELARALGYDLDGALEHRDGPDTR